MFQGDTRLPGQRQGRYCSRHGRQGKLPSDALPAKPPDLRGRLYLSFTGQPTNLPSSPEDNTISILQGRWLDISLERESRTKAVGAHAHGCAETSETHREYIHFFLPPLRPDCSAGLIVLLFRTPPLNTGVSLHETTHALFPSSLPSHSLHWRELLYPLS